MGFYVSLRIFKGGKHESKKTTNCCAKEKEAAEIDQKVWRSRKQKESDVRAAKVLTVLLTVKLLFDCQVKLLKLNKIVGEKMNRQEYEETAFQIGKDLKADGSNQNYDFASVCSEIAREMIETFPGGNQDIIAFLEAEGVKDMVGRLADDIYTGVIN